uniref:DUF4378 domain-containing protein n=1 Tax=Musa acuminata subsp. malaccensis TaxID=214687 RepID=A0A804HST7_MUSAM|nr:PREDICTED: uncharacterized protein LOC103982668 isoform X1 [Musa acuminata subsp. malaccensis]
MGGISHIFDYSKAGKSQKWAHKKHGDGFEAPRNSLDVSIDTSIGYYYVPEDNLFQYSFQVKHPSKMYYSPNGTPMKKLIDGEISKRTTESKVAPSVVARLMGMDSMPSEEGRKIHAKELEADRLRKAMEVNKIMECSLGLETSRSSTSSRQTKQNTLLNGNQRDPKAEKTRKPRKHPQEELLQKFKKEFETWQASKLREHPGSQKNHILGDVKDHQIIAQEILNKEKMAKYLDTKKILAEKKPTEAKDVVSTAKQNVDTQQGSSLQDHGHLNRQCQFISKNNMAMKLGTRANDSEFLTVTRTDKKQERSCSPTRIVILKPNFDRIDANEELLAASTNNFGKECAMEDFLEEVKERLKNEIQGKNRSNARGRGTGIGTSFGERTIDPKQIARDIAKHIRESVTKDIGSTLIRSESTRSIRSDLQVNSPDSPEFIRRDTRKYVSEKSKNVLKNEIVLGKSRRNHECSDASTINKEKAMPKLMSDFANKGKNMNLWKDKKAVTESIPRQKEKIVAPDAESVSQWNLVRSFSAPVSGTAFGKLLLEDQHITGTQICRKQEASQHGFSEFGKQRKDSFSLKGRVSSLKHNFNLKGKLFGKTARLIKEPTASGFNSAKEIPTAPSIIINSGITQENSTEVPPSPASVSSSTPDEFCKQDNPSPISPLEVMDHHTSPCVSEVLSSNAPEPHLLEHVEDFGSEMAVENQPHNQETTEKESEDGSEMEVEEQPHKKETIEKETGDAAYLQDILVTAGFYEDRSTDQATKLDALTRPISLQVFEQVEEACSKYGKLETESTIIHNDDPAIGHKLLFDLVNEALQSVLGPKINCSMFKRWILGPAASSSQGRSLLDDLWNQIQSYLNSPMDESDTLNIMVVQDLKMTTWPTILYEDIDVVARQIERVVLHDIIFEIAHDMCLCK